MDGDGWWWMDGWMYVWMDGWMDGWMEIQREGVLIQDTFPEVLAFQKRI